MSIGAAEAGSDPTPEDAAGGKAVGLVPQGELPPRARRISTALAKGVEERLFDEPYRFDFFQAVRILQRFERRTLVGYGGPPGAEAARFRAHVSLSFPASSIHDLIRPHSDNPSPVIIQAFLGLTGPSGVLPRHYTEMLYRLEKDRSSGNPEKHALRDWLDLFNHRFVSLFYRAWEKYRFFIPFERGQDRQPEPDLFTACLYSLVGLGVPALRNRLQVVVRRSMADEETESRVLARIENLALLKYGGLLAQQLRSAAGLQAMLQDYFQLPFKVRQYQGQWLQIEPSQQSRLQDGGNNQIGLTTVIGERAWDIQSKFRLRLGPLDYTQFLEFLPDLTPIPERKSLYMLIHMVRLYVGPALDFDVQLVLKRSEVPECQLEEGLAFGKRLGWNTWLRGEGLSHDPEDAVFEGTEVLWIAANKLPVAS
jgi:type VI secretion system protein ImpH